jgi:hypothetical protein
MVLLSYFMLLPMVPLSYFKLLPMVLLFLTLHLAIYNKSSILFFIYTVIYSHIVIPYGILFELDRKSLRIKKQ